MSKIRITTKLGDNGTSRLFSNETVSKTDPRLDAFGDIDELVSFLGVARSLAADKTLNADILRLQKELFIVASELATTERKASALPQKVDEAMLKNMDDRNEALHGRTDIPNDFIVPGENALSAHLDYARTICRRCERKIVALYEAKIISNRNILVWINRCSDYLYLLARSQDPRPVLLKK